MSEITTKQPTTPTTACKMLIFSGKSVVGLCFANLLRNLLQPTTKLHATLFLGLKSCVSNNKFNVECSR